MDAGAGAGAACVRMYTRVYMLACGLGGEGEAQ